MASRNNLNNHWTVIVLYYTFFFSASVPILICPIGLLVIGVLSDKIGRRKALQIGYIPLIISWLVLAYANTLKVIMIGRIILGSALGKFNKNAIIYYGFSNVSILYKNNASGKLILCRAIILIIIVNRSTLGKLYEQSEIPFRNIMA